MASSILSCISPTVPNIRRAQSPILITCRRPPYQELFHSSWITRKVAAAAASRRSQSHSWISAFSTAASPDYFCTKSDAISDVDDDAVVFKQHSSLSSSTLPSRISPWLMLPPSLDGNDNMMVYNFYSLKDDKVVSINKRDPSSGVNGAGDDEPSDDSELKGSSHGWLVLYNRRNLDLFLSNPLSRRHIKLPPIHTLRIPKFHLEAGFGCVTSVILTSPPDDEDCRAIMIYGPEDRYLAFCCPGRSTQWTHIDELYIHQSFVPGCSSRRKLFFSVNDEFDLEVLDVRDPSSPKSFTMDADLYCDEENFLWHASSEEDWLRKRWLCDNINFLVVADEPNSTSDLLLVTRHTMREMYPDGISGIKTLTLFDAVYCDYHYDADGMRYPYKTFDFIVHKYDPDEKAWKYMDSSLDGLAVFVGNNHSFAMRASDFPELKPDSIYFTDVPDLIRIASDGPRTCNFGGHDIGIYNYKDKTFSSCYYPCDVQSIKRIEPAPLWFTPSPL